jgi:NADPH-dependent ferric siderophore reductase
MGMFQVRVARVTELSPHLVRVTLAGDQLRGFADDGPDQRFKLLLPRPGQQRPVALELARWYEHWKELAEDQRPVMRTYTIRQARPALCEVDVDILLHSPAGPGSRWAATARPGDEVAICGAWAEYELDPDVDWQLLAADHCALPAVAAILERARDEVPTQVIVEVGDPRDRLDLILPPTAALHWVRTEPGRPGAALARAVAALPSQAGTGYAWVAADQRTAATIRRHLVSEGGLAADRVAFMGYWRTDGAVDHF